MRTQYAQNSAIAPLIDKLIKDEKTRKLFSRTLEFKKNIYLYDHNNYNAPVLFTVSLIETMAEAAQTMFQEDFMLKEISDFNVIEEVNKINGSSSEILIDVFSDPEIVGTFYCRILSDEMESKIGNSFKKSLYSQGTFYFGRSDNSEKKRTKIPEFSGIRLNRNNYSVACHPLKFIIDGPLNNINKILTYDEDLLITSVTNNNDDELNSNKIDENFITDPSIIESMLQSACILETLSSSRNLVPQKFNRAKFHQVLQSNKEYICIVNKKYISSIPSYDITLVDMEGSIYIEIYDLEMSEDSIETYINNNPVNKKFNSQVTY